MKMRGKRGKAGFTLVEIMIVVLIIALLAAIAVPSFMRARIRSQQSACVNNLRMIDAAKEQWAMEGKAGVPDGDEWNIYISGGLPECPIGAEYTVGAIGTAAKCATHGTAGDPADL